MRKNTKHILLVGCCLTALGWLIWDDITEPKSIKDAKEQYFQNARQERSLLKKEQEANSTQVRIPTVVPALKIESNQTRDHNFSFLELEPIMKTLQAKQQKQLQGLKK